MKLTAEQKAERAAFHDEHHPCWMCELLGWGGQIWTTELHHIAVGVNESWE